MTRALISLPSWHHAEFAFYVLLAVVVVYFPPQHYKNFGAFLERHFGDAVGFYILHLGLGLVILGAVWSNLNGLQGTGNSLILAGMVALKLKTVAGGNSNGNGTPKV